ncbi:adenylate/guanylate cyclase domain-containing protein [Formosa maritima]|uniref:Tetratricopeptide repeat protein n=1 Tax=Formosa maritima TaxID=2592046 RepID=A0A5D0FZW2_9FLAO|nr:adenylate/guanylate cyclase domain-containing protein [Formosa maritima]TYA52148.1 tetratricopeptide repeat protein [Formosa maritima]
MNRNPLHFIFFICFVLNSFGQSDQSIENLKQLIAEQADDSTKVNTLLDISFQLYRTQPDSSIVYSSKAIDLATEINFKKGLAYANKNLGLAYYSKGEFVDVLNHWEISLAIFKELNDEAGVSNLLSNIGAVYQTKGNDPKALDYFITSVKIAEKIQDSLRMGTVYLNMGAVYSNEEKTHNEAIESYNKSKIIFSNIGYDEGVGFVAVNMAELYLMNGNPQAALPLLNDALEAYSKAGSSVSHTYNYIGEAYKDLNQYELAKEYQLKAIEEADINDAKLEKTKALISLGELLNEQKEYLDAVDNFKEGLKLTEITGVYRDKKDAYEGLSKAYSGMNDYKNAYGYQQLFTAISDTIRNATYDESISKMRFQYDLENKDREIKLLNVDNELKQTQIERSTASKRLLYALAILLLALVGGSYFRYRYIQKSNAILAKERNKSESILLNILPKETAEELKEQGFIKAKYFKEVSVLFTDFKQFSLVAEEIPAEDLVKSLDYFFKKFDIITEKHSLEKIKTIGDAYMCAGGLPTENKTHAENAFLAALEILEFVKDTKNNPPEGIYPFEVRIGINTGPVIAGVVGIKKFQYDIWGSTVNIAARMENNSVPGKINVSENTYQHLKDKYDFTYRGKIKAKNEQFLNMYYAEEKK